MRHLQRTKFDGGIIAEFLPPVRRTKHERVIVLCDGMPAVPSKGPLMQFLSHKGYWVFHPRYRGTWESEGVFLQESPAEDITRVLRGTVEGFRDAWSGEWTMLGGSRCMLLGSSFGGAVALLASRSRMVEKVVAFSPLVDWTARSKTEPLHVLETFVSGAFCEAYRTDPLAWDRLAGGAFCNPVRDVGILDGAKILIVHAKDDEAILPKPVEHFAKRIHAQLIMLKRGGHMGLSTLMRPSHWRRIKKFLA